MQKQKQGHWSWRPSTREFVFQSPRYRYELDRSKSLEVWQEHLRTTKVGVMTPQDIDDLGVLWRRTY